jgi:Cu+-exporting ATPase
MATATLPNATIAAPLSIDPVCGMTVDPAKAAGSAVHEGTTYHFCSQNCLHKFQQNPEKYATRVHGADGHAAHAPAAQLSGIAATHSTGDAKSPVAKYTCPMHPQIVRDAPGSCPICGMALEPLTVTAEDHNPELAEMSRRFWISLFLTIPVFALSMSDAFGFHIMGMRGVQWVQFALANPVVLWGGWPFFVRGWRSILHRSLNMFTLIAIGSGVAFAFSVIVTIAPAILPPSLHGRAGEVPVYFEAAAVITTLVLLGQVLELRARSKTGSAIRALLGLTPKTARLIQPGGSDQMFWSSKFK